ncbi:major facilitator superfamily transporter [Phlyctema vagabunda]|uniref:Major facilitator superfamily transporter n=1 Tax=Phlyctema vagabunda TaxID=108571 RepID=A0ABR4PQZ3_9HELO
MTVRSSLEKSDEIFKVEGVHDEGLKSTPRAGAELPESIRHMSETEILALRKRLVRKIDFRLMPMLILLFLLNILDRNNFTNARLGGLEEDIGLTDHQYNTCLMIMYVGYLLFQFPSNVILSRFPRPGIYLSVAGVLWGTVSSCMAAAHSYGSVIAIRFFLGFVEAPFFPGALLMLTSWYARSELPFRIAVLYAGNTLSNCFGGLIAAAVLGNMEGVAGLRAWRWLFILEGCITVVIAIIAGIVLPNYPKDAKWLSIEENEYAVWRIADEAAGVEDGEDGQSVWVGAVQALKDPKVYMLILLQFSLLTGMAYTYFFPSIVKTLGYNKITTLLLTAPPYALAFFTSLGNSLHSGKTNERAFHIAIPLTVSMLGNILCITLTSTAGRYASMFLMTLGVYSAFNVTLSWVSSTIPRPKSKRAAALAMVNSLANCTHLFTSYLYPDSQKPRYLTAGITLSLFCGLCAATAMALRFYLKRENSKMDREEALIASGDPEATQTKRETGFGFRYTL